MKAITDIVNMCVDGYDWLNRYAFMKFVTLVCGSLGDIFHECRAVQVSGVEKRRI